MLDTVGNLARTNINDSLYNLENKLKADCLTICGAIEPHLTNSILHIIEDLKSENNKNSTIDIILTTSGGDAITVERIVNILRENYSEVNFIVPDYAYSAGTIFCMSGDNILMDYFSILGPIDPQVMNKEGKFVPALGYLEKINELIVKSQNRILTEAEFLILKDFDLAELHSYEQARNLTIDLLESWLVEYKFKNWDVTETNGNKVGKEEKLARAREIAESLSDYSKWKSHGRPLNIKALEKIGLRIQNYGKDKELQHLIRTYHSVCIDYINLCGYSGLLHSRRYL